MDSWDRAALQKMTTFDRVVHLEIEREQVTHIPLSEYTEERVATLLAKMEQARRFWPGTGRINT